MPSMPIFCYNKWKDGSVTEYCGFVYKKILKTNKFALTIVAEPKLINFGSGSAFFFILALAIFHYKMYYRYNICNIRNMSRNMAQVW